MLLKHADKPLSAADSNILRCSQLILGIVTNSSLHWRTAVYALLTLQLLLFPIGTCIVPIMDVRRILLLLRWVEGELSSPRTSLHPQRTHLPGWESKGTFAGYQLNCRGKEAYGGWEGFPTSGSYNFTDNTLEAKKSHIWCQPKERPFILFEICLYKSTCHLSKHISVIYIIRK